MDDRDVYRRNPRHPIATRPPVARPARIELRVRKGYHERRQGELFYDDGDDLVCTCFPKTSDHTIPSMFYDKITCPHPAHAHIQPAQKTQFNYPWTANSVGRRKNYDDDLSERLSLMSQEEEQLRFSPGIINRQPEDVLSVATAPPYWYENETDPRTNHPPFTAPADYENHASPLGKPLRALSMQDIRDPVHRIDGYPNRRALTQNGQRNSRISNRQFTGNYVDPKSGKVYKYNVNYDGTPQPKGALQPIEKPATAM